MFEHARIPLNKMLQAVYLVTGGKKGVASHQLHRILEITYKSGWFSLTISAKRCAPATYATQLYSGAELAIMTSAPCKHELGEADRFKQAARELGCEEDQASWDERLKKAAGQKPLEKPE